LRYEVEHVLDYVSIIKLRFEDLIEIKINIGNELYDFGILKLTLQPLVENCIIHGFEELSQKGLITVSARENSENLNIEVADNGKGIAPAKLTEIRETLRNIDYTGFTAALHDKSESIGLKNIHLRLVSYYGPQYGITSIRSEYGKGACIVLTLPAVKPEGGLFHA